jgi:hypothetical protein
MPVSLAAVGLLLLAAGVASTQDTLPPVPPSRPASAQNTLPPVPPSRPPASVQHLNYSKPAFPLGDKEVDDIRQVQNALPKRRPTGLTNEQMDYLIQLLPPDPERMFRLYSEEEMHEQIRQEDRERTPKVNTVFPDEPPVTTERYAARQFPRQVMLAEAAYVNYKRLYFEDKNSERYGWDLGILQPLVSNALFYKDLALLPYHFASRPLDCIESSAGYCQPGDPVEYLCDPPNLSVTGSLGDAAAIIGLIAIFP